MSKMENVDKTFGESGDFAMGFCRYKVPAKEEGEKEITRYRYGGWFNYHPSIKSLEGVAAKLAKLGNRRVVSVISAPFSAKAEAGEFSEADAQAFVTAMNGQGLVDALEKVREKKAPGIKLEGAEAAAVNTLTKFAIIKAAGAQDGDREAKVAALKAADKDGKKEARRWAMGEKSANSKNWQKALKKAQEAEALSFE